MKNRIATAFMIIAAGCCMVGCNGELTKEEVIKSTYYQELLGQSEERQDKISNLKEKLKNEKSRNLGRSEAVRFLEEVEQGYFVKLQVNDQLGKSYFVDYQPVFEYIKEWISRGQCLQRYSKEKTITDLKPTYEYYLYDEDNSTYMMQIYENDYVCFQERPNDVFVIYGANDIGDAFVSSGDMEYTELLKQLKYAPLAVKGEKKYYQSENIKEFSNALENTEKQNVSSIDGQVEVQYLFFYHGQVIRVDFYESGLAVVGEQQEILYQMEKENVRALKKVLMKQ